MKRAEINQIARYKGELVEVFAIGEGRTVYMRPVDAKPCASCGSMGDVILLEDSPLFQDNVEPVATIGGAS